MKTEVTSFSSITTQIKRCIDEKRTNFVIFPFGQNGLMTKQVLNQCFGINELFCIDNDLYQYNPDVKSFPQFQEFAKTFQGEITLLLATFSEDVVVYVKEMLADDKRIKIVDVLQYRKLLMEEKKAEKLALEEAKKRELEIKKANEYKGTIIGKSCYGPLAKQDEKIASIGSFCSFAPGCEVVWNHQLNMVTNHAFIYSDYHEKAINNQKFKFADFNQKFVIGNDVWLGTNVILTNGVKIGNGVRAAAGAVITKDVPDYAVVAGVPAKIIKYRFTKEQIRKLNEIAWWDWPIEKIKECYDDFMDIEIFLRKHYKE